MLQYLDIAYVNVEIAVGVQIWIESSIYVLDQLDVVDSGFVIYGIP